MEPFIHAIIPVLILLALFPKLDKKHVFYLVPIIWIIDLDLFLPTVHRFLSHNLFFVALIGLILYLAWDKKAAIVGIFYGLSHLVFDLVYPGVAFLYPLYQKTIYFTFQILKDSAWVINLDIGTLSQEEYIKTLETVTYSTWISEQPVLIGFLILIGLIFLYREKITSFFSTKP